MAYCTLSDVQSLFANVVFDAASPVSDAEIETVHIPTATAYIDARLRPVYALPITASTDLELLRLIAMHLVAGIVAEILYETSSHPNEQASARRHREWAEGILDRLLRGEMALEAERISLVNAGVFGEDGLEG
ncbi:MAG: hypothetical protein KatS3mg115_1380 [Candidatus Poribacteria bacterium]|nr:MAG: hypothetical protein KatS3mg115_1380 [Candidatus Poribacteria bacterium]